MGALINIIQVFLRFQSFFSVFLQEFAQMIDFSSVIRVFALENQIFLKNFLTGRLHTYLTWSSWNKRNLTRCLQFFLHTDSAFTTGILFFGQISHCFQTPHFFNSSDKTKITCASSMGICCLSYKMLFHSFPSFAFVFLIEMNGNLCIIFGILACKCVTISFAELPCWVNQVNLYFSLITCISWQ